MNSIVPEARLQSLLYHAPQHNQTRSCGRTKGKSEHAVRQLVASGHNTQFLASSGGLHCWIIAPSKARTGKPPKLPPPSLPAAQLLARQQPLPPASPSSL